MERLTERLSNGVIRCTGLKGESVMSRLSAYEETDLTPAGVAEMKERQRRIPVSERLPIPGKRVMMCMGGKSVYEGYVNQSGRWDRYDNDFGTIKELFGCSVTHWMPLPELPKEAL